MLGLGAVQERVAAGLAHLNRLHQAARRWAGVLGGSLGGWEQQEAAPTSTSTMGWAGQQNHGHSSTIIGSSFHSSTHLQYSVQLMPGAPRSARLQRTLRPAARARGQKQLGFCVGAPSSCRQAGATGRQADKAGGNPQRPGGMPRPGVQAACTLCRTQGISGGGGGLVASGGSKAAAKQGKTGRQAGHPAHLCGIAVLDPPHRLAGGGECAVRAALVIGKALLIDGPARQAEQAGQAHGGQGGQG
jgi:hypothetical protein